MSGDGALAAAAPFTVVITARLSPRSKSAGPPTGPLIPSTNPVALARRSEKGSGATANKGITSTIPPTPWALRGVDMSRDRLPLRLPRSEAGLLLMEAHAVAGGPSCWWRPSLLLTVLLLQVLRRLGASGVLTRPVGLRLHIVVNGRSRPRLRVLEGDTVPQASHAFFGRARRVTERVAEPLDGLRHKIAGLRDPDVRYSPPRGRGLMIVIAHPLAALGAASSAAKRLGALVQLRSRRILMGSGLGRDANSSLERLIHGLGIEPASMPEDVPLAIAVAPSGDGRPCRYPKRAGQRHQACGRPCRGHCHRHPCVQRAAAAALAE